jgi:DNA-damage-inducible protein J
MYYICNDIEMKTLQVRLPNELREEADHVLEEIGMDMSTAIRVYLKKIVQSRSIPFALEAPGSVTVAEMDVDSETQTKMDDIARSWDKAKL